MESVCAVCSVPSTKFCSNCHKVYYCGQEHQKSHRKSHRPVCYPVELRVDELQGRHFVTTKTLGPGDLIFVDEAIVHGPSGAERELHRICVGCCVILDPESAFTCKCCDWPVCDQECASLPSHAANECQIFSKNGIKYKSLVKCPINWDLIKYLRTALLKGKLPDAWAQLANLAAHNSERAKNPSDVRVTRDAHDFICNACNLGENDGVTFDDVNHIVGIWTVNSLGANPPGQGATTHDRIAASFLFPKTSLASHGCIANTNGILVQSGTKFSMKLHAACSIVAGQPIYITYVNVAEGTAERQRVLQNSYYFTCTCRRCVDPSECGTNYQAIRCSETGACTGFMLPLNPVNLSDLWKCSSSSCGRTSQYAGGMAIITHTIKGELAAVLKTRSRQCPLATIKALESLRARVVETVLHPNHWVVIEIEYNLMQVLTNHILSLPGTAGKNDEAKWTTRLVQICKHCLAIADVLQPGLNSYRGNILYCLVEAQLNEVVLQINSGNASGVNGQGPGRRNSKNRDPDFTILVQNQALKNAILPSAQEAYQIFSLEPESSANGALARKLANRSSQIHAMIENFDKM